MRNNRVSFESYDNALRILSWFFPGRDFCSAAPGQLHGDPGCVTPISGVVCVCALAPIADASTAPSVFKALTHAYLHHVEVDRFLSAAPGSLSIDLASVASSELSVSLAAHEAPRFLGPTLAAISGRIIHPAPPVDCTEAFSAVAVRGLVFDTLCTELPNHFSSSMQPCARDLLRRWLLSERLFDDPLRCLEEAWGNGPVRSHGYHDQIPRLTPLFSSWVATLRVGLLDDRSRVCRLFSLPQAGEGLLSLRSLAARSCRLVEADGVLYGSCPGPVVSWLSRTHAHELFEGFAGPPLLQELGLPPVGCRPQHWSEAAVLYADGGFRSFTDALTTAALL